MAKRLLSIQVKGQNKIWSFNFIGDPKYLEMWREDGLDIDEVINIIPDWVVFCKLTKPWIFFQDLFNFRFKDLFK